MKNAKRVACLLSTSACLIVPNLGVAADNCSGLYVNVGQSAETTELASGNTLVMVQGYHY